MNISRAEAGVAADSKPNLQARLLVRKKIRLDVKPQKVLTAVSIGKVITCILRK